MVDENIQKIHLGKESEESYALTHQRGNHYSFHKMEYAGVVGYLKGVTAANPRIIQIVNGITEEVGSYKADQAVEGLGNKELSDLLEDAQIKDKLKLPIIIGI